MTPEQIDAMASKIPGRVSVRIYQSLSIDQWSSPKPVLAERRFKTRKEMRSSDAGGRQVDVEFVFFKFELGATILKEKDVIEDLETDTFFSVEYDRVEMMSRKVRVGCVETVDPRISIDE